MNQIVPTVDEARAVAVLHRRPVLVPESMSEAMKLAELMAGSGLVPEKLQKKPGDCLMIIMQAIRWEMDPFAVAQECSVIQGKLMYSGKLVAAVVNARGNLSKRLSFSYAGSGDARTVTVSGQRHGESTPRVVDAILRDAKTSNTMWVKQPDQQLAYHGARKWARLHAPELMLGVGSPEEWDEETVDEEQRQVSRDIVQPGDYDDGIPEKLTKPKEEPKHTRYVKATIDQLDGIEWESRSQVIDWLTDRADEIKKLCSEAEQKKIREAANRILDALKEAEMANLVVHDSDDIEPRPATKDDFEPAPLPPEPQPSSTSQRAIRARENLSPDEVADYLRS